MSDQPDGPRWWVIAEPVLEEALQRAAGGEPVSEIMLDLDAEATSHQHTDDTTQPDT
jgi:hypothetical protein